MVQPCGRALSPDGDAFYMSWTDGLFRPGNYFAALQVSDGAALWERKIEFGGLPTNAQYPAVGRLGKEGPLAVVAVVGDQPMVPRTNPQGDNKTLVAAVVAMDAATGEQLWLSEEAPWPHAFAAGDEEERPEGPRDVPICLPDQGAIPVIAGDGTVYAASSHSGDLRAIRHVGQGAGAKAIEVSTFKPGYCFLNSPSLAPGLLAAAPCWGPTYVFVG